MPDLRFDLKYLCTMIQRRQTLYLLVVAIIAVLLVQLDPPFYTEAGELSGTESVQQIEVRFTETYANDELVASNRGLSSLLWASAAVALISIFLFGNRKRQLLVVRLLMLMLLALYANLYWYSLHMHYTDIDSVKSFLPAALSPLGMLLFAFLAHRGIVMDERLVRSLDRLR